MSAETPSTEIVIGACMTGFCFLVALGLIGVAIFMDGCKG